MRWETRYSSAEMGYLEVLNGKVVFYLNSRGQGEDTWTFEEVLAGAADYVINSVYGSEVTEQMKAEVRSRIERA